MVLTGVGNGCWAEADVAGCETDCDMVAEDGGVLPGDVSVAVMAVRPLNCGFIEEQGGEVGVRGWMGFVVWPLALAATSKGGEAGEYLPELSRRWRFAL